MSLRITSTAAAAARRTTNFGTSGGKSFAVWHRRDNSASSTFLDIRLGAASTYIICTYTAGGAIAVYTPSASPLTNTNNFTHSSGTWIYYCLSIEEAADEFNLYAYDEAGNRTDIILGAYIGRSTDVDSLDIGRGDDASSAVGEYRYLRFWDAELSTTQFNAERTSATAVKTDVTYGSWALPDGSTTTDAGSIGALTFGANVATDTDEPTLGGASAVINKLGGPFGGPFRKLI